jgi:hypothetical protein
MAAAVYDPAAKAEQVLTITDKDEIVQSSVSTGVVDGGILSVNGGDNTKFDISAGFGYVIDTTTTPSSPSFTKVSWTTKSALTLTYLATHLITFVSINSAGTVIQQTSPWTAAQRRDDIILGVVVHVNLTVADTVNNQQAPASNVGAQLHDLYEAIGFLNVDGNVFGPSGADLTVDKTEGHMLAHGSNWDTDTQNPHERTLPALTDATFQYRFQDGTNGVTGTVIDPNIYDNAGVSTAVPTNKWTVQRFFSFTSNNVKVQPGQTIYNSKSAAIAALTTESFTVEPSINANGLFRTWLVVKQGATDLSDENEAVFFQAGKFGASTASAGGSLVSELNDLSDVDTLTTPPNTGEVLEWDGINWVPGTGGSSAPVTLDWGLVNWNTDFYTLTDGNNVNIFNSTAFPSAAAVVGTPLTADFNFGTVEADIGFVAPTDGAYEFTFNGSLNSTSSTGSIKAFGNFMLDGVVLAGETTYNYDDIGSQKYFPMSDSRIIQLSAGDVISYRITAGTGTEPIRARYQDLNVKKLTFDAALALASQIEDNLIEWSDRSAPLTFANQSTYTATIVGRGADGRPIYEAYEELTDDYTTPYTATALWTGANLLDANSINVEVEVIRGFDNTGGVEYRGQTSVGQFGFFTYVNVATPSLFIGRSTTDNGLSFGTGSVMGIRTRWQDSTDTPSTAYVAVPEAGVITLATLQAETAAATDFADFQARIAAL